MRYFSADNGWVSTEAPAMPNPAPRSGEELVERGLLHPDTLNLASAPNILRDGIVPSSYVRLTDGPGAQPRWASYYDVMMTNPWGYGTINTVARGLARLPLKIYESELRPDVEPGTVRSIVHPDRSGGIAGQIAYALRYPNVIPNDGEKVVPNAPVSRRALWYATVVAKLIYGNAIWEIRRGKTGILGFQFIPSDLVDMDQATWSYTVREQEIYGVPSLDFTKIERKADRVLDPTRVVHFGLWESGRAPWNPSPVRSLHHTIALYDAASRHLVSYFNNSARPSGLIKVEPSADPNARAAIRDEVLKTFSGPSNAGRVLVVAGEWQSFYREPQFDQIINLLKTSRDEIFVTYGVPPPVMGVIERAIMSNVREMRDQYVRDLIGPHAEFFSGDFEAQVIDVVEELRERNVFAYFDVDEQLRPDVWTRATTYRNQLLVRTPNELRREERLPRLEGDADPHGWADTIQRPLNESPLNNAPNYVLRDELQERRVEIEEQRLVHQVEMDKEAAERERERVEREGEQEDGPEGPDEEQEQKQPAPQERRIEPEEGER